MAAKERWTEHIRLMTEMLRFAWLSLLAGISGTVGLLLGELRTRRLIFATLGVVTMACFVIFIGYLVRRIKTTIDQLPED